MIPRRVPLLNIPAGVPAEVAEVVRNVERELDHMYELLSNVISDLSQVVDTLPPAGIKGRLRLVGTQLYVDNGTTWVAV